MRASPALALLTFLLAAPGLASTPRSDEVLELAHQRYGAEQSLVIQRALEFAGLRQHSPSVEAMPRALVVARNLLLDEEAVRPDAVAAAVLIGHEASLQDVARHVDPNVALRLRELRKPGILPGCAASTVDEAEGNLRTLRSDLRLAAVYAHVDALRPGRRPDLALTCIKEARSNLLPALRDTNPALAESLDEDVAHLEQRYTSELSGEALLTDYRRADGTLDWRRLPAKQKTAFTLDLFLRELVAVANTGDRERMEQFFEGLASTDFFEHYGAFALGGPSQIVNARYLSRYLKPAFVEELMRSNVNLVLGQHVSDLARGEIQTHVFSVSLTSLGLSAATIRAGMTALGFARRVQAMKAVDTAKKLARVSRFETFTGWAYVIAETVVVVYISEWKNEFLQERRASHRAKDGLHRATQKLLNALSERHAPLTEAILRDRLQAYHVAWGSYREYLLRPVFLAEQKAGARLASLAEEGKRLDDKRKAILSRLGGYPGLMRLISSDHASLDAYAGSTISDDERRLEAKLEQRVTDLLDERRELLREVYTAKRREGDYLSDVPDLEWHLMHLSLDGKPGDPGAGRDGVSGYGFRARSRMKFRSALRTLTKNRLQTYDDEAYLLRKVAGFLGDKPALRDMVLETVRDTLRAEELDRSLAQPR